MWHLDLMAVSPRRAKAQREWSALQQRTGGERPPEALDEREPLDRVEVSPRRAEAARLVRGEAQQDLQLAGQVPTRYAEVRRRCALSEVFAAQREWWLALVYPDLEGLVEQH